MKKNTILRIGIIVVIVCLVGVFFISALIPKGHVSGDYSTYYCDVKNISLSTKIEISDDSGSKVGTIKGNIFAFLTDPLTMYDTSNNKIAYAGDAYAIVDQDSHGIYVNNNFQYDMDGKFALIGEKYDIYDSTKILFGVIEANGANTNAILKDANGKNIAEYTSKLFMNDFEVKISDDCDIDHITIIMMFASYYSDQSADKNDD